MSDETWLVFMGVLAGIVALIGLSSGGGVSVNPNKPTGGQRGPRLVSLTHLTQIFAPYALGPARCMILIGMKWGLCGIVMVVMGGKYEPQHASLV